MLLTKLLDGSVCTPRQLQGHVNPPALVLNSSVSLKWNPWTGRFRYDGYQLKRVRQIVFLDAPLKSERKSFTFLHWVSPSHHSWTDLSLWCWFGRWCGLAQHGTHIGHCHRVDVPLGLSVPSSGHINNASLVLVFYSFIFWRTNYPRKVTTLQKLVFIFILF